LPNYFHPTSAIYEKPKDTYKASYALRFLPVFSKHSKCPATVGIHTEKDTNHIEYPLPDAGAEISPRELFTNVFGYFTIWYLLTLGAVLLLVMRFIQIKSTGTNSRGIDGINYVSKMVRI